MALTKIGTDGFKDDAVTTDKLANAINTERTANTAKVSTTINNNADNRVITGSGTANTLEGEANLTYNGTRLNVGTGDLAVTGAEGGDAQLRLTADEGDDGADYWRLESKASDNNFNLATYASGAWVDKVSVDTSGNVGIGEATPLAQLHIKPATNKSQLLLEQNNAVDGYALFQDGPNGGHLKFMRHVNGTETQKLLLRNDGGLCFGTDSAAANALDDYEEGTWTPTVTSSNGLMTMTYSNQVGSYTKIGRQVTIHGFVRGQAGGTQTNILILTNLPFNIKESYSQCLVADTGDWSSYESNHSGWGGYGQINNSYIVLLSVGDKNTSGVNAARWGSTTYVYYTMTYFTDS